MICKTMEKAFGFFHGGVCLQFPVQRAEPAHGRETERKRRIVEAKFVIFFGN